MVYNRDAGFVLLYEIKTKFLRGVWQVKGCPFYEETQVWKDRLYPFRCRIKWSKSNFQNALKLDDTVYAKGGGIKLCFGR